ncbi:MAG: SPOR domain-containing protein [Syntrophales bacterium]
MSKRVSTFPGGNKKEGTKVKRLVNFCSRKFCVSIIILVFFSASAAARNVGDTGNSLWSVASALAQPGPSEVVAPREEAKSPSAQESNLMRNLLEKQKELDNREKALKEEEQKIEALKKDVAEKMEALKVLEEKMSPTMESQKGERDKRYQSLAKIYEGAPPEKAAAIFEKMDRKMAAEIMLRMSSKKAGAIWAHMNHEAGLQIVREITASQSVDATKATKIAKEITGAEAMKQEAAQSPGPGAAMSTGDVKGREAFKPETRKSTDTVSSPGGAKEIAPDKAIKPEPPQKAVTRSAAKKEIKIAKSKKTRLKNTQRQASMPFAIQIKAVRGIEMATEFTKVLKDEGLDAYWSEMRAKDGGTLYKILVGRFASREEALTYMKEKRVDINYPGSYIQKSEKAIPHKKEKKK